MASPEETLTMATELTPQLETALTEIIEKLTDLSTAVGQQQRQIDDLAMRSVIDWSQVAAISENPHMSGRQLADSSVNQYQAWLSQSELRSHAYSKHVRIYTPEELQAEQEALLSSWLLEPSSSSPKQTGSLPSEYFWLYPICPFNGNVNYMEFN